MTGNSENVHLLAQSSRGIDLSLVRLRRSIGGQTYGARRQQTPRKQPNTLFPWTTARVDRSSSVAGWSADMSVSTLPVTYDIVDDCNKLVATDLSMTSSMKSNDGYDAPWMDNVRFVRRTERPHPPSSPRCCSPRQALGVSSFTLPVDSRLFQSQPYCWIFYTF